MYRSERGHWAVVSKTRRQYVGEPIWGGTTLGPLNTRVVERGKEYANIGERMDGRHRKLEERSLALHREIAQRIRSNPALLTKVRKRLSKDISSGQFFGFSHRCNAGMARPA